MSRSSVWLALGLAVPMVARAQSRAPGLAAPTLRDVLEIARRRNPDIVAAQLRVDSAHAERRIARALPNPSYTGIPGTPYEYGVALPIDLNPARIYRTRAAGEGEAEMELARVDVVRQVSFAVREGFYDLLLADAEQQIAREQLDIFRQVLAGDSVRLRAGDLPQRDLVKSELEAARAEAALARADAVVRGARLALQALMGESQPDTAFTVTGALDSTPELSVAPDSLIALALATRQDLAAAREAVSQSRSLKALALADLVPVPVVSVVYQNTPFQNGLRYAFGVTVPVPLLYWNGGERQRAAVGVASAEVTEQRVRLQIAAEVTVALGTFQSAGLLANRYAGGLLAQAAQALDRSRFAYRQGAASFIELLDAIRTWGDTRAEYYQAVHDYWVAAYALSRATGADIVRE